MAYMLRLKTFHRPKAQVVNGRGILHFALVGMIKHPDLISSHYESPVVLLAISNRQLRVEIILLCGRHRGGGFITTIQFWLRFRIISHICQTK